MMPTCSPIKPSDVSENRFEDLLNHERTTVQELKSQMRVLGALII